MCRTKKDVLASDPKPTTPANTTPARRQSPKPSAIRYSATSSTSLPTNQTTASAAASSSASSSSISSGAASLTSLRLSISLSDNPTFYPFADISAATNNFLSRRLSSSSSSSSWRCSLRGNDVVIFQRAFHGNPINLPSRLSALCRSHHSSLVKLLGASIGGEHIYLVYEHVAGASLRECLRNPRNPNFTPLSKWISRMQVATDLAEGMDYIHRHCGTIHNLITSSSVIVTEPNFNAKISHFGAVDLAGDIPEEEMKRAEEDLAEEEEEESDEISAEITPAAVAASPSVLRRSDSRRMRIEGTRGYIAPEVIAGGRISRRSDVFAFGVVILELISGREPLKYTMNPETQDYERVSLIETARAAIGTEDEDGASEAEAEAEERRGRVRRWVDRRLRDSFPADAAEQLIRVALWCVEEAPFMRPETQWLAGKVSKLFLDSKAWEESVRVPSDFSVSLAPR